MIVEISTDNKGPKAYINILLKLREFSEDETVLSYKEVEDESPVSQTKTIYSEHFKDFFPFL